MTRGRRRGARDEGISSVLGAVLVFGLLIITLVTIQIRFVPVWDRDREAEHMTAVGNQLAQVKSDLDRLADNRTSVPVSDPLALQVEQGFRFFRGPTPPSELVMAPAGAGEGITVGAFQAHVLEVNGRQIFAGSETWTQVVQGDTITNVGPVQNLRVRILNPANWNTGDSVSVVITDALGHYAGKFVITNTDHGETFRLRYETYAATSSTVPISQWDEDHDKGSPPTYIYIDLLEKRYQFDQVLASSTAPSTLTLNRNNLNADYTAAYTQVTPSGGSTQVGGSGRLVAPFAQTLPSGRLILASHNQRYVDQTYVVEHGAVILAQSDGAAMFVPPSMAVRLVGGIVDVRWIVPGIQGTPTTLSGPATASLSMAPGSPATFLATLPRLDVTLSTQHGTVWAQYWTTLLQGAGLTYGTQFTVGSNTTAATLTVFGVLSDPLSQQDDLTFSFQGAGLSVSPRAGA
jgi:hypothetical protein